MSGGPVISTINTMADVWEAYRHELEEVEERVKQNLDSSVALAVNIFGQVGIQVATNGVMPFGNYLDVSPVNLTSGNPIRFEVRYASNSMDVTLIDLSTFDRFQTNFAVNVPDVVASTNALVGITGATGGIASFQTVSDFGFGSSFLNASALTEWRDLQDLPADGSEDTANPSGDGVVNLLKFAFNLAPNAGDLRYSRVTILEPFGTEGMPRVELDSEGRLVIAFLRRKPSSDPGVEYVVETGDDLLNLQPLSLAGAELDSIDDTWERVTVTDPDATPSRFGRVRVIVLP